MEPGRRADHRAAGNSLVLRESATFGIYGNKKGHPDGKGGPILVLVVGSGCCQSASAIPNKTRNVKDKSARNSLVLALKKKCDPVHTFERGDSMAHASSHAQPDSGVVGMHLDCAASPADGAAPSFYPDGGKESLKRSAHSRCQAK